MRGSSVVDSQHANSSDPVDPPPYSAQEAPSYTEPSAEYPVERVDEQVRHVRELCAKTLDEGQRGAVISASWLARVIARTSEGANNAEYSKEARQGPVGPLDNSDILAENATLEPILHDAENTPFIPIKPGLQMGQEFQIVPWAAYDFIVGQYGSKHKHPIVRYVHDTAPADATAQNLIFEVYPPVITIRKVPQPNATPEAPLKPRNAVESLRLKKEREARGQRSADDAIRLVSSRNERFKQFLVRAKEGAGIPRSTKVKLWRVLDVTDVSVDAPTKSDSPMSLSVQPDSAPTTAAPGLVLEPSSFAKMDVGIEIEHVDAKDETNNDKYNGKLNMETLGIFENQTLLLEEQVGGPGGGEFQSDSKKSVKIMQNKNRSALNGSSAPTSGRTSPTGMVTRGRLRRDGRTRGTVGLTNLGNTCYMNSALQCIRSVEELATFFLSNAYKKEINNDNPLGHHGAMANSYAQLLRGIYSETATGAFTPNQFKRTLGSLQPLFSGYGQQDSQEFLSFLVDALHEDLNRIMKKPYNENPDSDDNTVHDPQAIIDLGNIYRKNHRARNDSIAMDLFSGFYKNTMECPVCDKISITFDPFSLLTVQLPIENTFQHNITFIPLGSTPINHALDTDKNSTIKAVKEHIAKRHPGVKAERLWMVEVYGHKIYKVFEDHCTLAEANIQANDYIFLFELDAVPTNLSSPKRNGGYASIYAKSSDDSIPVTGMESAKADCFAVPIFNRAVTGNRRDFSVTMHPLYITVTREEAKHYDLILKKTLLAVSRLTSRPFLQDIDSEREAPDERDDAIESKRSPAVHVGEDSAGVSDHSAPSEDGYVNVTLDKSAAPADGSDASPDKMQLDEPENDDAFRKKFLDSGYALSEALRNQLFALKYVKAVDNMHYTGMNSINENNVGVMLDRVQIAPRRNSVQSLSEDGTSTSTGSPPERNNDESEESDADDLDKPDIVLGESTLSAPTVEDSEEDEGSTIMEPSPIDANNRGGRRRAGKKQKWNRKRGANRHDPVTYNSKDRARLNQKHPNGVASNAGPQTDNPYYIQLGDAIILDWRPEALDALFNGDADVPDDLRGYRLTDDDGKHVPLFPDAEVAAKRQRREDRRKNGITLEDCFAETGKREVLSEDNAWYCNRCKEMRRAAKTLEIWTIPDILVVHLKRFGGTRSFRDKLDVFVDYPIEGLDMTDKIGLKEEGKEYVYDLFAVDNHYGGLGGGHYTALAKNIYDGEWYDYNDSTCTKLGRDAKKLHSPAAYLLFYRRRSNKPLGPQYLQDLVHEARHPSLSSSNEDLPVDSEPGEDRLGGPTPSSLHGSSSALPAAGAAVTRTPLSANSADGGPPGALAPAATNPTPRQMTMTTTTTNTTNDPNDILLPPPSSSSSRTLYSAAAEDGPSWSFASLNARDPDRDAASDADSTHAQLDHDRDSAIGVDDDDRQHSDFMLDDHADDGEGLYFDPSGGHGARLAEEIYAAVPGLSYAKDERPLYVPDVAADEDAEAVEIHVDGAGEEDDLLN